MTSLYVVIVTYNGSKWIDWCLSSVYQSSIALHCIVVDNNSLDNTVNDIKKNFPQTLLIESKENLGFGKANNIGIRLALERNADYIYLLNQDASVNADTFEKLIDILEKNKNFGIISPVQLSGTGKHTDELFLRNSASPKYCRDLLNDFLMGDPIGEVYETSFVMAAHWMIRTEYLRQVGLFSPAFPHYGEDTNLIQRFQFFSFKIGLCPSIYAYHDRGERKKKPMDRLHSLYINNMAVWHNVNEQRVGSLYFTYWRITCKILFLHKVGISKKIKAVYKMAIDAYKARKYKKNYIQGKCYLHEK